MPPDADTPTDEVVESQTTEPTPPESDATPTEPMFTEAEVQARINATVKERLARDRRKRQSTKQEATPTEASPELLEALTGLRSQQEAMMSELATLKADKVASAFAEAFTSSGLDESLKPLVQAAVAGEKPKDVGAFIAQWRDKLAPAAATETPEGVPMPGGSPAKRTDFTGPIHPKDLTAEDRARLRKEGKLHEVLERFRHQGSSGGMFPKRKLP